MKCLSPNVSVRLASAVVAAGLGFSSCIAAADEWFDEVAKGYYIGAGLGQSKISDVNCNDPVVVADAFDQSCSAKDTATAFKLFGGYKLPIAPESRYSAAIELGYVDFGKVGLSGTDSAFGATKLDIATSGINLSVLGAVEVIERWSLIGKLGLLRWNADYSASSSIDGKAPGSSDSGTGFAFGIGGMFAVTPQISARLEWERFDMDDANANLLSASVVYAF
ncbi:MAG: outer membrane beta-barrel protein [Chromatiales bacterium]|jgi:OOP family OmpA-OmpF porin|nr:outer membrane beta-barrel protein [Chromatiales bacterium]